MTCNLIPIFLHIFRIIRISISSTYSTLVLFYVKFIQILVMHTQVKWVAVSPNA